MTSTGKQLTYSFIIIGEWLLFIRRYICAFFCWIWAFRTWIDDGIDNCFLHNFALPFFLQVMCGLLCMLPLFMIMFLPWSLTWRRHYDIVANDVLTLLCIYVHIFICNKAIYLLFWGFMSIGHIYYPYLYIRFDRKVQWREKVILCITVWTNKLRMRESYIICEFEWIVVEVNVPWMIKHIILNMMS